MQTTEWNLPRVYYVCVCIILAWARNFSSVFISSIPMLEHVVLFQYHSDPIRVQGLPDLDELFYGCT